MSERPIDQAANTITDDEDGIRLDRWIKRRFGDIPHGQIQKWLRTGQIRVGGKRAEASNRVTAGQTVRIPPQLETMRGEVQKKGEIGTKPAKPVAAKHDKADLQKMVLFEDDDVIIFNKPPGLAVQGGTGLKHNLDDMLAAWPNRDSDKPKLVHRLDRDTSGVVVVARSAFAAAKLTEAFRHRNTRKIYWAITFGVAKPASGLIEAPLIKQGEIMRIAEPREEDAKSAATHYYVVEAARREAAFVALSPITGRTHQLRVHMQHVGTPILGDRLYGGDGETGLPQSELGKGLHLHARQLIIPHPRRGTIDVTAPLSPAMRKTWEWFGFSEPNHIDFPDEF